ncbi:MAG: phosphate acyltransferase PlsX, partial [Pseudorhodobacter sp.]|nr:phosphate acyltransferase PlsX [Frankiaceae bacterium]
MVRVALDLLGGDRAPEWVGEGALRALAPDPDLEVLLVGPVDVAERLLAGRCGVGRPDAARCALVAASQVVEMDEDPARAV